MHVFMSTFEASSVSMSFSSSRMLPVDSNNSFRMVSSILCAWVSVCVCGGQVKSASSIYTSCSLRLFDRLCGA